MAYLYMLGSEAERGREPCPRCVLAWEARKLDSEMIRPLPASAPPRAHDGTGPCCHDCAAADDLVRRFSSGVAPAYMQMRARKAMEGKEPGMADLEFGSELSLTWYMARICVGNDRRDQYRMPGLPTCLAHPDIGLVRHSSPGDLEVIHGMLDDHALWTEWDLAT